MSKPTAEGGKILADILLLVPCLAFGASCACYLSVIGFAFTLLATLAVLFLLNRLAGGVYSGWGFAGAYLMTQIGYFAGVIGARFAGRKSATVKARPGYAKRGGDFTTTRD